MRFSKHRVVIDVGLDDEEGGQLRTMPIVVTYGIERETEYGADADGHRGVKREEVCVFTAEISPNDLIKLTIPPLEYVMYRLYETIMKGARR